MSRIISFRGLIADGSQERILLKTKEGLKGYRIVKLDLIPNKPVTSANESVVQIWKIKQTALSSDVNFSDNELLGIGIYSNQTDTTYYPDDQNIIFDSEIFNQDIFITHVNETGAGAVNYFLELEQMTLDLNESTVATLKNMRNTSTPG